MPLTLPPTLPYDSKAPALTPSMKPPPRMKKELLELGKKLVKNPFGHIILVYNRERTSCDLVRSRSWFEIQDFQTSIKYYVHDNNKDLGKLMEYVNERT